MDEKRRKVNPYIPQDIQLNILSRLPAKSVLRFKSVCKQWRWLLEDPVFIKMHYARPKDNTLAYISVKNDDQYLLYSVHEGGTTNFIMNMNGVIEHHYKQPCNGFYCFPQNSLGDVVARFYNPTTREDITIPCPGFRPVSIGIGFDEITNIYKIVSIDIDNICRIFTLGTSLWRMIYCSTQLTIEIYKDLNPICVNGVLYWSSYDKIVSFDVKKEELGRFPIPKTLKGRLKLYRQVELEGCFCLLGRHAHCAEDGICSCMLTDADDGDDNNVNVLDLWMLKPVSNNYHDKKRFTLLMPKDYTYYDTKDEDVSEQEKNVNFRVLKNYNTHFWVKHTFRLPNFPLNDRPIVVSRNGDILTVSRSHYNKNYYLHSYNLQSGATKRFKLLGLPSDLIFAIVAHYDDSLISSGNMRGGAGRCKFYV